MRPDFLYRWEDCKSCGLHKTRDNVVLGTGNRHARIMIISDYPGSLEDENGYPFVETAPAGKILDEQLDRLGWKRSWLFIDNALVCRPCELDESTGDIIIKEPTYRQIKMCNDRLMYTIYRIDPILIISMGTYAYMALCGRRRKISTVRGEPFAALVPGWYKYVSYIVIPTFNPAYISRLRRDSPDRKKFEADLDYAKELYNLREQIYAEWRDERSIKEGQSTKSLEEV